jgi:hypothetical protein
MYADHLNLAEARELYFKNSGFGEETYTTDRWVRVDFGPLPFYFLNTAGRKAIVPLHDLHHILNNYPTTFLGEAQIGAWEIASDCRRVPIAWVLNREAIFFGSFINLRAIYDSYRRGKVAKNLYRARYRPEMLTLNLGEVRRDLFQSLSSEAPDTTGMRFEFALQWILSFFVTAFAIGLFFAPMLGVLWLLWYFFFSR